MLRHKAPKKEKKGIKKLKKTEESVVEEEFVGFDYVCHFDGSYSFSKLGYGYCIIDTESKEEVYSYSNFIKQSKSCSSVAEYLALSFLLVHLEANLRGKKILIIGDSKMAIDQMTDKGKINRGNYAIFAKFSKQLLKISSNKIELLWKSRKENKRADELSKCY